MVVIDFEGHFIYAIRCCRLRRLETHVLLGWDVKRGRCGLFQTSVVQVTVQWY